MAGVVPPIPVRQPPPPDSGLAVASLVLGLVSIPSASCLVGGLLGVIGIITGAVHLSRYEHARVMAIIGCVLSAIGIMLTAGALIFWARLAPAIKEQFDSMEVGDHSAWIGVRAPELTLITNEGKTLTLADLKGKRVIIDVFHYSDPDCQEQIKQLNALFDASDPEQLVIIGLTTDTGAGSDLGDEELPKYHVATLDTLPRPYRETIWYPTTFYIDRNGVIDAVTSDNQSLDELRNLAFAPDYPGTPADAPGGTMRDLTPAATQLEFASIWSTKIRDAQTLCAGDWDSDGTLEVLVLDDRATLHVVDSGGNETRTVALPEGFRSITEIEAGTNKEHGVRLLGLAPWTSKVLVSDSAGKQVWTYAGSMGINGAHWGDLDGDGTDEMIVGMNGFGGLHAVDAEGGSLWKVRRVGNVWSQAIVSATPDRSAWVVASEAGGQVYLFDKDGNKIRAVRPGGHYYTTLAAAAIGADGRVQIAALGDGMNGNTAKLVAFDERGFVAWNSEVRSDMKSLHSQTVASGDIDGNTETDWLFLNPDGNLIAATADGLRLGSIVPKREVSSFAVLAHPGSPATIVTLGFNEVTAFRADAAPTSPPASAEEEPTAQP